MSFLTAGANPLGDLIGGLGGSLFGSPGSKGSSTSASTGTTDTSGASSSSGQTTSTGQQTGLSTTSPNLPDWYTKLLQGLGGSLQSQMGQSGKPLYGAPQQAQFFQGLNQQYGAASNQLMQQLAKSGALNSGRAAEVQTQLGLGKLGQQGQYMAQAPIANRQYSDSQFNQLLGQGMNFKIPFGQTTQSNQTSLSDVVNNLMSSFNQQGKTSQNSSTTSKQGGTGLLGSIFG